MRKTLTSALFIIFFITHLEGQEKILTVAEKSDFKSTSNYSDVNNCIESIKKTSKFIRVEKIAVSAEGRDVNLLVIGNPLPASPADLKNDNRIVIYIQGNIHAGEVEGKEALLMFTRDLLSEKNPEVLKKVIFLICPLFNPDGNEKISTANRTTQNGPVNGVGVRYNGQFLDLNRDAMKAESPEVQGVITNVFNKWDPSVFMDCHTTDGSYHVEPTTFTWMVNPNGDNSLISYMRNKMMPEMSNTLREKYKTENCFYGEMIDMLDPQKGWILDASEPRYMSNYFGVRNRLGILNENYIYSDFRSRVFACYNLIKSLADYSAGHSSEIKDMLKEVDKQTIMRGENPGVKDSFAIEYKVRQLPEKVTVKTYEAESVTEPNGRRGYKKTNRQIDVSIPYFVDYYPTRNVKFPFAYVISVSDPDFLNKLRLHGIKIEKLVTKTKIEVQRFVITDLKGASRLNQGHYTNTISGKFVTDTIEFQPGTVVVKTAQPLANIVAYLLEPQSNDGFVVWNVLDRYMVPQWGAGFNTYPVYKIINKINLNTTGI